MKKTEKYSSKIDLDNQFEYKDDEDVYKYHLANIQIVIGSSIVVAFALLIMVLLFKNWLMQNL